MAAMELQGSDGCPVGISTTTFPMPCQYQGYAALPEGHSYKTYFLRCYHRSKVNPPAALKLTHIETRKLNPNILKRKAIKIKRDNHGVGPFIVGGWVHS
jgi:hypothetical protein